MFLGDAADNWAQWDEPEQKPKGLSFKHATDVSIGDYIVIDKLVCRVDSVSFTRPGRHGSSKFKIVATEVSSGKTKEMANLSSQENVGYVEPLCKEYTAIDMDVHDDAWFLEVIDDKGDFYNFPIPDKDMGQQIRMLVAEDADFVVGVRYFSALGEASIVSYRQTFFKI